MAAPDSLAHLSNDIIIDVLEIGCPKFEDLKLLEKLDKSSWAAVIRCGKKFARGSLRVPLSGGVYFEKTYFNGLPNIPGGEKSFSLTENWNDLLLTNVSMIVGKLPLEIENQVLRHVTRRLQIYLGEAKKERIAEILEILSKCHIPDVTIHKHYSADAEFAGHWEAPFRKLLTNPFIQSLALHGELIDNLDLLDAVMAFVKRPNFVYFDIPRTTMRRTELISAVIEHWMEMTVFPSQMQGVCFSGDICDRKQESDRSLLLELGFQLFAPLQECAQHLYYKDHPTDASKRIEAFLDNLMISMELRLTSKEASVDAEFGEYENFKNRSPVKKTRTTPPKRPDFFDIARKKNRKKIDFF